MDSDRNINGDKIVDSDAFSLQAIFSDKYEVDFFQREYVWQYKQLEDLINDLSNEFLRNYETGDTPEDVRRYDPYYMGEIVVSSINGKNSVIDGQQRITTLTLLLIYLKNHFGHVPQFPGDLNSLIYKDSYGTESFNLDVPERRECMTALNNGKDYTAKDTDPSSVQNLIDRYNDIEECWNKNIDDSNVVEFVYWLENKVMFSKVWTNSDEFAYVIFETMNDRGLSLTPVEMLRSYLLANINAGDARSNAMKKYDSAVKKLKEINLGSKSKAELEFFKVYFRGHFASGSMAAKSGDSDFARIGKEFHRWVQDKNRDLGLISPVDYCDFIDKVYFYANIYSKLFKIIEKRDSENYLYVIVNDDYSFTLQPAPILAAIKYDDNEDTIEKKIKIISKYLTKVLSWRVWGHWQISQSSMEAPIYDLCSKIRDADIDVINEVLSENPLPMPDIDTSAPMLNHQNRPKLKVLLSTITEIVARNSADERYPKSEYILNDKEPTEVEHIWCNHFDRHPEFDNEQSFSDMRNNIGALLVLPKSFNASYNDSDYEDKVQQYFNQNILAKTLNPLMYNNHPGFSRFVEKTGLPFKSYEHFDKNSILERANLYRSILQWNWNDNNEEEKW